MLVDWWYPWGMVLLAAVAGGTTVAAALQLPALSAWHLLWPSLWMILGVAAVGRSDAEGRVWPTLPLFVLQAVVALLYFRFVPTLMASWIIASQLILMSVFQRFVPALLACGAFASSVSLLALVTPATRMYVPHMHEQPLSFLVPVSLIFLWSRSIRASALAHRRAEGLVGRLQHTNALLEDALSSAHQLATMRERTRIARDLHDSLGHALTTTHVFVQVAKGHVSDADGVQALEKAEAQSKDGLRKLRECIAMLREKSETQALSDMMRELISQFEGAHIRVGFTVEGTETTLDPAHELALYRTLQEALTNVAKHARADEVEVTLSFSAQEVRLHVRDNGAGASLPEPAVTEGAQGAQGDGHGLRGLGARLAAVGGSLELATQPKLGFALTARLRRGAPA